MCGITGIVYKDTSEKVSFEMLSRMCGTIKHRGPDDTGLFTWKNAGIGMTRLSIIDLEGGHQPVHNEDETVWIVFNGEIYNYAELRSYLSGKGHTFYTSSDTESIVHLYEEHGEDCVKYLRGMFAFAIWDIRAGSLFMARDRMGIKPFYYYHDGGKIVFGSEIKAIMACEGVPCKLNPQSLVYYMPFGYVPDPDSMFLNIHKLPPGHSMTYCKGRAKIQRYWDIEYKPERSRSEEFYIERILELLEEAVKIRLMSEVPLGAFLSGGIDSGMVVALMAKNMGEPVKTFSIGFEYEKYNELQYARAVAKKYGTDHHEEIVNPDAESVLQMLVNQFDEPFADSSAIPTFYVSRMAKKWVTVALSGDGGDELFGGYGHYLEGYLTRYSRWIPEWARKKILLNTTKALPEWFPGINVLRHLSFNENERIIEKYAKGLLPIHSEIFSREFVETTSTTDPSSAMLDCLDKVRDKDVLTKLQYLDMNRYLPCDILTKVDQTSMMVSLEARVPILDHHLVEFAATIPPEMKVKGMTTKYLFKKAAERLLPKEVIYRPKHGFAVPVTKWIRKEWEDISRELVLGERALARCNFNPKFLNRIMAEHKWGRRDHGQVIWTLMVLELWFRRMIDGRT